MEDYKEFEIPNITEAIGNWKGKIEVDFNKYTKYCEITIVGFQSVAFFKGTITSQEQFNIVIEGLIITLRAREYDGI